MKITKKEIKSMGPCKDGWAWYLRHETEDLRELLLSVNSADDTDGDGPDWAWWILKKLLADKKKLSVKIAIYSARLVLDKFEKEFPDDKQPREAIEAAEKWLSNPTEKNRYAAAEYARSAKDAKSAEYAKYAKDAKPAEYAAWVAAEYAPWAAAWYAARAAAEYAAEWAAGSAEWAAECAWAAWSDTKKDIQEKILNYAVDLLEGAL